MFVLTVIVQIWPFFPCICASAMFKEEQNSFYILHTPSNYNELAAILHATPAIVMHEFSSKKIYFFSFCFRF